MTFQAKVLAVRFSNAHLPIKTFSLLTVLRGLSGAVKQYYYMFTRILEAGFSFPNTRDTNSVSFTHGAKNSTITRPWTNWWPVARSTSKRPKRRGDIILSGVVRRRLRKARRYIARHVANIVRFAKHSLQRTAERRCFELDPSKSDGRSKSRSLSAARVCLPRKAA